MDGTTLRTTLSNHGIDREVSDAIIDYVGEQKSDLVTGQKLELEMSKLRGELREEMVEMKGGLKTDFANHRAEMYRLVLGTSGLIGLLVIAMRLLPS